MAFIEMACNCGASFQYETENELRLDLLSQQFINQHTDCGYMSSPHVTKATENVTRYDITYKERKEKEL